MDEPTMLYRPGKMATFDGVGCDYVVVDASDIKAALKDGWSETPAKTVKKK